jgi:hypothetical protein
MRFVVSTVGPQVAETLKRRAHREVFDLACTPAPEHVHESSISDELVCIKVRPIAVSWRGPVTKY